jgi:hypothetical protein
MGPAELAEGLLQILGAFAKKVAKKSANHFSLCLSVCPNHVTTPELTDGSS